MNIDIVHIIDERSKEIYSFKYGSNSWIYSGITYSFRDDRKDVWGDDWSEYYQNDLDKELNRWALKTFQEEFNDLSMFQLDYSLPAINDIKKRYNPVILKTKHGHRRLSGQSFGHSPKPQPKITNAAILQEIVRLVSNMEICL
tara:strand:+ start:42 stop:470 length:429 start_codon:yes stop_codon:yes gene_type:complete